MQVEINYGARKFLVFFPSKPQENPCSTSDSQVTVDS